MINCFGPLWGHAGYQVHSRKFFQALNKLMPVRLVGCAPNKTGVDYGADLDEMLERGKSPNWDEPTLMITSGSDLRDRFPEAKYKIGFPVFECTRFTPDWIEGMRQMDELWTPSTWGRQILLDNGFGDKPIHVVPEGFDPLVFHPGLRARRPNDGIFRFLCVGKWETRKGQVELLRAYTDAFRGECKVELILSCHNPWIPGFSVEAEIHKLKLGPTPPIKLIQNLTGEREMASLYAYADCFVLPTKAEGWGLPIMEAMACGLPVITTAYGAILDYAESTTASLMEPAQIQPIYDPLFFSIPGESGTWASVSASEIGSHMKRAYEHSDNTIVIADRAAQAMASAWTWDHAALKARVALIGSAKSGRQRFADLI